MRFYEIDGELQEAVNGGEGVVRLRVEILLEGEIFCVPEQDILQASFYSIKEVAGGVSSRGEILIDNTLGFINGNADCRNGVGMEVRVWFSVGECARYFKRFTFFTDEKGVQVIKGPGRKRFVRLGLRDLSYTLRKIDEARDWTAPAVFTYSVVCDKTQPQKSLVHRIAQRAGIGVGDIDCPTIPVTLPFVRLRRNVWAELSSLATACRCHLEFTPDNRLVFSYSPYQIEELNYTEIGHTFSGEDIFYLRKIARDDLYRNTVRLKVNMPVALQKQEIWRYDEPPVFYDENLQAYYPFRYPLVREIEAGSYEARYKIIEKCGRERNVIFADEIDTKEEAEKRLEYEGGGFSYSHYDTSGFDKAFLTLRKEADGDLYRAAIYGRPIVLDLNRSSFMRNAEEVALFGTVALNITGSYFSEYEIDGIPQYEDWVIRELAERVQNRRGFTVRTHRGVFNARVGARVKIKEKREESEGTINALSFRYKRNAAFVATFRLMEHRGRI